MNSPATGDGSAVLSARGSSEPASPWVGRWSPMPAAAGAWTTAGVLLYVLAPRTAPFLLPLSFLAPLFAHRWLEGRVRWPLPAAPLAALGIAGLYLLIACTWSLSPEAAYGEIAGLLLFVAALYATLAVLAVTQAPLLRAMAIGFVAAVLLGAAVLCFEAFSGQAVHRLVMALQPTWGPDLRHARMDGAKVAFLEPHLLNRSMTALAVLFWPAALAIESLRVGVRMRAVLLLGLALAIAAIFRSEHTTSKLALIAAAATYGLFLLSPIATRRLAVVAWIAATLFVVPLASLAYGKQLYLASWLPRTAGMRVVIWGHTAAQIDKAPLFGVGVSSGRALSHRDDEHPVLAPGSDYRLTTGWHSHNAYLQTWFETGAVGAVLLLAFGLLVLRAVAAAPPTAQPYLCPTFVACAVLAGSSFSLWASWFLASFGFAAVFAALGSELAARAAPFTASAAAPGPFASPSPALSRSPSGAPPEARSPG